MSSKPGPLTKPRHSVKKKLSSNKTIDLNCDLGEGYANDKKLFPFISSANIACGYHAGDEKTIWKALQLAKKYNVRVGAHVSYFDRDNFGRIELDLPPEDIYELVTQQLILLKEIADGAGVHVQHVKPHGALYNQSARNKKIAATIARAVNDFDPSLILFGLSGSHSVKEADKIGLRTASEVFADRRYKNDGSLVPRTNPKALIDDRKEAITQALQIILKKTVTSISGKKVKVDADTMCIHGDGKYAVEFAKAIFQSLNKEKIAVKAL